MRGQNIVIPIALREVSEPVATHDQMPQIGEEPIISESSLIDSELVAEQEKPNQADKGNRITPDMARGVSRPTSVESKKIEKERQARLAAKTKEKICLDRPVSYYLENLLNKVFKQTIGLGFSIIY